MTTEFDELLGSDERKAPDSIPVVSVASSAPSVYADGCIFATQLGSCVRMTFVENIFEPNGTPEPGLKARHVGTLVLPLEGYTSMLRYLNEVASKFIGPVPADGE